MVRLTLCNLPSTAIRAVVADYQGERPESAVLSLKARKCDSCVKHKSFSVIKVTNQDANE